MRKAEQDLAAANHVGPVPQLPEGQSALVTRLLLQWSAGAMSATELQKHAHAAVVDGLMHPEVYKCASLGSWGQYPANINRDLKAMVSTDLPDPDIVRVPCLDTKPSPAVVCYDDAAVVYPHLWIAALRKKVHLYS